MRGADCASWQKYNVRIIPIDLNPSWTGMFWRMLPITSGSYRYVCIRDLDSVVTAREASAVSEWIESGTLLHIMRDHPAHTAPIMGGMFGVKADNPTVRHAFRGLKSLLMRAQTLDEDGYWQIDQNFLRCEIYPLLSKDSLAHDPYYSGNKFPIEREMPHLYVGRPTMKIGKNMNSDDYNLVAVDQYLSNRERLIL